MIPKQILRKRLSVAIGKDISPKDFTWFFDCFCKQSHRSGLKSARKLTNGEVQAFSAYSGYDLRYPIPLPLWS